MLEDFITKFGVALLLAWVLMLSVGSMGLGWGYLSCLGLVWVAIIIVRMPLID